MIDMDLPGAELVAAGLADTRARRVTAEALALRVFARRLHALDIVVDSGSTEPELALYEFIRNSGQKDAYSRYNSLLRRLDSFSAALEQRRLRSRRCCAPPVSQNNR
jgi:hypothetical protein